LTHRLSGLLQLDLFRFFCDVRKNLELLLIDFKKGGHGTGDVLVLTAVAPPER
jgi:hypothetical protein